MANGLGAPGQNLVVGRSQRPDRLEHLRLDSAPARASTAGCPSSWADGSRGWNGWLEDAEYPRIVDPPGGRIWTANARVVDGEALAKLGDGSYEIGSRARLIRDRLMAKDRFTRARPARDPARHARGVPRAMAGARCCAR